MAKTVLQNSHSKYAALYIRVSTDFQAEEGYSIEAQQKKLEQYCAMKDIENYELYIDGGFSGSNLDRPRMRDLISDIISDKVNIVVVYKLDRLSRSQKDTVYFLEDVLEPTKTDFVSLNENFDTSTPYGKAMIGILSVFAQLERENIRDRTRMGMIERVRSGKWMGGGRVPYGYDYDRDKGILVIKPDEAKVVKEIYDLYLQGYSTTRLAQIYKFAGKDVMISNILDRITYTGAIKYNDEVIVGQHEPIIDQETWKKVQERRRARSTVSTSNSQYLLSGLIYCGICGAKMRYQTWGKDKVKIYCYSQQKSSTHLIKDPDCDNYRIDASELESLVLSDLFQKVNKTNPVNKTLNKRSNILEVIQKQYNLCAAKLKRLYNLYAVDGNELLLQTIEDNKLELTRLQRELDDEKALESISDEIKTRHENIHSIKTMWGSMNNIERKNALRSCIRRIEVNKSDVVIKYLF